MKSETFFTEQSKGYASRFVDLSMDIAAKISEYDLNQFCRMVGEDRGTVISWRSGIYNFTLLEIAKIEQSLNIKLL